MVRIGLLGCGNVGAALVQLVDEQQGAIEARTGLRLEIAVGRGAQRQPRARRRAGRRRADPRRARSGRRPVDRSGRRGDRWHRAGARADHRPRWPTASRSSPPTRSCWPTSAPSCTRRPTTPASTCCSRQRSPGGIPLDPCAAREPARRADQARDGHRQRHDQLHPHQDDRGGRRLRRRARRGTGAGVRRARPHRRRRGLRRRRQGGDHRHDRVRREGGRRRRVPRGHQPRAPPTTSPSPGGWAMW